MEIPQEIPLIEDPFYDGEYSSNRRLKSSAKSEKILAKEWLIDYKLNTGRK